MPNKYYTEKTASGKEVTVIQPMLEGLRDEDIGGLGQYERLSRLPAILDTDLHTVVKWNHYGEFPKYWKNGHGWVVRLSEVYTFLGKRINGLQKELKSFKKMQQRLERVESA